MIIENKKVVSVNYILTSPGLESAEEEFLEQTTPETPFVFLYGAGGLLEEFETNLKGLKKGDAFDFKIMQGYGPVMADHLVNIPIEAFRDPEGKIDDEMVNVGNTLPMSDNQGNRLMGLVVERTDAYVRMDFNHPLAGRDLHFKGEVLDIRDASAEEIAHGHVHGEHGHHH